MTKFKKPKWRDAVIPLLLAFLGFIAAFATEDVLSATGLRDWFAMRHLHYVPILVESLVVLVPLAFASAQLELVDLFVRTGFASLGIYVALVLFRFDFRMFVPQGQTVESTLVFTIAILFATFFAYAGIVLSFISLPAYLVAGRLVARPAKPSGLFDYAHVHTHGLGEEPFAQGRGQE